MASSPETNPRMNKDGESCVTSLDSEIVSFTWHIRNFLTCMKAYGALKSTTFLSRKDNSKWYLYMMRKTPEDKISLNLHPDSPIKTSINVIFECFLLDDKHRVAVKKEFTKLFPSGRTNGFGFDDFASMNRIRVGAKGLLPHGMMTISCKLQIVYNLISEPGQLGIPECDLTVQLNDLQENPKFHDVILMPRDGIAIHANKCILAARSVVFSHWFAHMILQPEQNIVVINIDGFNHNVLMAMLRYIYTGRTDAVKEMPAQLLVAAEAYALQGLKIICEQELCLRISVRSVVNMLVLAHCYEASNLKKKAMDFMNANSGAVGDTADFFELMKSYPQLMSEVYKRRNDEEGPSVKRIKHSE